MDQGIILRTQRIVKWIFGLGFIAGGLDKILNILADWSSYISPFFEQIIPLTPDVFMYLVGALEIILGIMFFTKWTRTAAYLSAAWVLAIAVNLTTGGWYDIAMRDFLIAVGLWMYGRVTAGIEEG